MSLDFKINIDDITKGFGELKKDIENDVQNAVKVLAAMTHSKIQEMVQENLHSSRKQYQDSLSITEVENGIWCISLEAKSRFLEDGLESGRMDWLLNGKSAKTSKDGSRYAVIPFSHNTAPSTQTMSAQSVTSQIKTELKKRNINFKKIEVNTDGTPKIGMLHKFSAGGDKLKDSHKTSPLVGVSVFQRMDSNNKVVRDVMTFRTISDKNTDNFIHPGLSKNGFFEKAFDWAIMEFENKIKSEILAPYQGLQTK